MNQTKRLGLSIGMGLGAGLLALVFGVFGAMAALIDAALVILVLRYLFPRTANQMANHLHQYLAD